LSKSTQKLIILNIPYLLFFWLFSKVGEAYRLADGQNIAFKIIATYASLRAVMDHPLPTQPFDLVIGLVGAAAVYAFVMYKKRHSKKWRKDREYGSARWAKPDEINPFMDPEPDNNIILTRTEGLTMNGRIKNPAYSRNKNVLVVGGSGSGKTRYFITPNIMQCQSKSYPTSFVIVDPKAGLIGETGTMLLKNGYKIKIFNTIDFTKSLHYNPFSYIHSERDILKLVNVLMANTKGDNRSSEEFWVNAEKLLYMALIGYIYYEAPEEERNFSLLLDMLNEMDVHEDDDTYKNAVDLMFDNLRERDPNHFAVRQYLKFRLAAGKTLQSILISCGARLAPFEIDQLRELTEYDELELDRLGDRKTALFIVISDNDETFAFLASMVFTQLFNSLIEHADNDFNGRLPLHVRCLIDEAANIGKIPKLERLMATMRSREISACLVLQAQSQLKSLYKDDAETIRGNCDAILFLGGSERTTLEDLSKLLGRETIDSYSNSISHGNSPSFGQNYTKLGKDLMAIDELAVLDGGKCILQLRGVRPFMSDKYNLKEHKNYRLLAEYSKNNKFNIKNYLSTDLKLSPDEDIDTYESTEVLE